MIETPYQGGCQCQAVRYQCAALPFVAYTCHCRACQKLTSSAFATCMQVPAESLEVIDGEPSVTFRVSDSGNTLKISYCGNCGSALFIENTARTRLRTILVGTLDNPDRIQVSAHIWVSRKLPWVVLPSNHRVFPEAGNWRPDYKNDPTRLES
jgi:hypothetical protein